MSTETNNLHLYLPARRDGIANGRTWGIQVNANFSTIDGVLYDHASRLGTLSGAVVGKLDAPASPGTVGQVLTRTAAGVGWADPTGGGGGATVAYRRWDPDRPPDFPSALSDEFESGPGLDSKWTPFNWASWTAVGVNTIAPTCLYWRRAGSNGHIGAVQALPAGDFTIAAKIRVYGAANWLGVCLALSTSYAYGSGSQVVVGLATNNGLYRRVEGWSNWQSQNTTSQYSGAAVGVPTYVRVRRVGSQYFGAWSVDGLYWEEQPLTPGFSPLYFGLFSYVNGATLDAIVDWIRYWPDGAAQIGGLVSVVK